MAEAYPLHWPEGWPHTDVGKRKKSSSFKVNVGKAIEELYRELEQLGAKDIVLSSNLTLNALHRPYSKQRQPDDPGIAVYFTLNKKPTVMARDGFADWRDNIRSLGLAVEAIRALRRHGGAHMMDRAFTGFAALEDQSNANWRDMIVYYGEDIKKAEAHFRRRLHSERPDRHGGQSGVWGQGR